MAGVDKERVSISIGGMQCSFCSTTISRGISSLPGVTDVYVNLGHGEMVVDYEKKRVDRRTIEETLKSLGYTVRDKDKEKKFEQAAAELNIARTRFLRSAVFTVSAIVVLFLYRFGITFGLVDPLLELAFAVTNVFFVGFDILKMSIGSLSRGIFNQHVLMEFSATGSLIGGLLGFYFHYPVISFFAISVFIASYHLLGSYLSTLTRFQTDEAIFKLMALQPEVSYKITESGTVQVKTSELLPGDLILVKPGERIPIDGVIVEGMSAVDESSVTGEGVPVEKSRGVSVTGGSLNLNGVLQVKAVTAVKESFLSRVGKSIEDARGMKPGIVQFIDSVLKYFVPFVLISASAAFAIHLFYPYISTGIIILEGAIYATVSTLIFGYPCALGMSTPLALERGHILASRKGILFRSADSFFSLRNVDTIVLDKTGTITVGKPRVTAIHVADQYDSEYATRLLYSLEKNSNHPLAKAVSIYAEENGIENLDLTDLHESPGVGVSGRLGGREIYAGSEKTIEGKNLTRMIRESMESDNYPGSTRVYISDESEVLGFVRLSDRIRDESKDSIDKLQSLGLQIYMLTGDSPDVANTVALKVGIGNYKGGMTPEDKKSEILRLQAQGHKIAMIGDGLNDAPAIAQANVGIAMGTGSDVTLDSADIVFLRSSLSSLLDSLKIARSSYSKTKQNLAIAFGTNTIGIGFAVAGLVSPIDAMIAMVTSASLVILNSFISKDIISHIHPFRKPLGSLSSKTVP